MKRFVDARQDWQSWLLTVLGAGMVVGGVILAIEVGFDGPKWGGALLLMICGYAFATDPGRRYRGRMQSEAAAGSPRPSESAS